MCVCLPVYVCFSDDGSLDNSGQLTQTDRLRRKHYYYDFIHSYTGIEPDNSLVVETFGWRLYGCISKLGVV